MPSRTRFGSKRHRRVRIARRSAGGVAMIEISFRPLRAMFMVRGMGVAVMTSTSGRTPLPISDARWSTPGPDPSREPR